jgi:hypothetical protein
MFFVSFHQTVANIYAYDNHGNQVNPKSPDVLSCSQGSLSEIRGIYAAPPNLLYVVNGGKDVSNILWCEGSGSSYQCKGTFLAKGGPINHPFALAFDGKGNAFVSNQDSNVVAAASVNSSKNQATLAAKPSPYLQAQYPQGNFLTGTFAASAVSPLPSVSGPTAVPLFLGGLGADVEDEKDSKGKKKPKTQNSVRDVIYYAGTDPLLFVVDEPTGIVRVYNPSTGQPLLNSNVIADPTHLAIQGNTLYVSSGSQVLQSPIPTPYDPDAEPWVFAAAPVVELPAKDAASGIAFDASGNLYVAGRKSQVVYVYDPNFKALKPWPKLADQPEFLLYMGGS